MHSVTTTTIAGLLALTLASCDSGAGTPGAGTPGTETPGADSSTSTPSTSRAEGETAQSGTGQTTLPSGLAYAVLKEGQGDSPQIGSAVLIHCVGRLASGQEFWNTRTAGVPQRVVLSYDQLITGMLDALITMKPGERRQVHVPSHLGYGAEGYPHKVPPRADLEMDLELVSIEP